MDKPNHYRDGIRDDRHKIILIWTPKAGCTLGVSMMFQHMGLLKKALACKQGPIHGYRHHFYRTVGYVDVNKHIVAEKYRVLKLIRNPYDRAVSQYLFCMKRDKLRQSFREYLQILKDHKMVYMVNGKHMPRVTNHSLTQYIPGEEKYVTEYLRLESIHSDLQRITAKYGWKLLIPGGIPTAHHTLREGGGGSGSGSGGGAGSTDGGGGSVYLGDKPFAQLPQKVPSSYRCFYNADTRRLVEELYGDDVRRYGYAFYE